MKYYSSFDFFFFYNCNLLTPGWMASELPSSLLSLLIELLLIPYLTSTGVILLLHLLLQPKAVSQALFTHIPLEKI